MVQQVKKSWFYRGPFGLVWGRVRELKEYIFEIEVKFQQDINEIKEQHDTESGKALNEQEASEIAEFYGEQKIIIQDVFLRTFRYSVVVLIYSFLESSMATLCRHVRRAKAIDLELDDIRGEGIERNQIYLRKVCGVDFPDNTHEWKEIQKLARVRNCIVHAQGDIHRARDTKKIENIVKTSKHLELEHDAYIVVGSAYVKEAIDWVETFLRELHDRALQEMP